MYGTDVPTTHIVVRWTIVVSELNCVNVAWSEEPNGFVLVLGVNRIESGSKYEQFGGGESEV